MSNNEDEPTKSNDQTNDDGHDDAADILTNLLQNQVSLSNTNTANNDALASAIGGGQVGEAQQAAVQQLLEAMRGDVTTQGDGADAGEKKHAFWDTQVRLLI